MEEKADWVGQVIIRRGRWAMWRLERQRMTWTDQAEDVARDVEPVTVADHHVLHGDKGGKCPPRADRMTEIPRPPFAAPLDPLSILTASLEQTFPTSSEIKIQALF